MFLVKWVVPVVIVFLSVASGQSKSEVSAPLPPEVLTLVKADLNLNLTEMQSCVRSSGKEFEQMIRTTRKAMAPRYLAFVVEGLGPCFSGANNGPYLMYVRFGNKWRKVFDDIGNGVDFLETRTNGFPDVARRQHGSAFMSVRFVYRFNGNQYDVAGCDVVWFSDPLTGKDFPKPQYEPCTWDWKAKR
jgi:hypothetical protein